MKKEEVIQILKYCKENDFLGSLIQLLQESGRGEKQPEVQDEKLLALHNKIMSCCKVKYPVEKQNEYGRVMYRVSENKHVFAFDDGVLLKLCNYDKTLLRNYLRYARRTGKIATGSKGEYSISCKINGRMLAAYALYLDTAELYAWAEEIRPDNDLLYARIIDLFKQNEDKFDKRGKNEYGRRISVGNNITCYALLPTKFKDILSSYGGDVDSFIRWAKDHHKLATDGEKNTMSVNFYNKDQEMYCIAK